jgi:hypothetical protein
MKASFGACSKPKCQCMRKNLSSSYLLHGRNLKQCGLQRTTNEGRDVTVNHPTIKWHGLGFPRKRRRSQSPGPPLGVMAVQDGWKKDEERSGTFGTMCPHPPSTTLLWMTQGRPRTSAPRPFSVPSMPTMSLAPPTHGWSSLRPQRRVFGPLRFALLHYTLTPPVGEFIHHHHGGHGRGRN